MTVEREPSHRIHVSLIQTECLFRHRVHENESVRLEWISSYLAKMVPGTQRWTGLILVTVTSWRDSSAKHKNAFTSPASPVTWWWRDNEVFPFFKSWFILCEFCCSREFFHYWTRLFWIERGKLNTSRTVLLVSCVNYFLSFFLLVPTVTCKASLSLFRGAS